MSQPELVGLIVGMLEAAGIEYMVTGSVASSMQGEPRLSHDIDFVIDLRPGQVKQFVARFTPENFYFSEEAILAATRRRSMFNVQPLHEAEKLDFWLLKGDAYDRSRFGRRYVGQVESLRIKVSMPEDTILYKLKWANDCGGSEKQFKDALRVYELQYRRLDQAYIDEWAKVLNVQSLMECIRKEARPISL